MSTPVAVVLHGATLDRPDEADTREVASTVAAVLSRLGWRTRIVHLAPDLAALDVLADVRPALVFNLVEALGGDGAAATRIPAELARRGLRFTGAGPEAEALLTSKPDMKAHMRASGLPTPDWSRSGEELSGATRVIVKAETEHASIGLDAGSVVSGAAAASEIAARQAHFGGPFFAETFVDGREFNVSLIEGPAGPEVLPPAEIRFDAFPPGRPRIVDYDAKWREGAFAYRNTPRRFDFPAGDGPLLARLDGLARAAWCAFRLSGYARVDFRVDEAGAPWLLEVNSNPCLAPDAGFAAAGRRAGIDLDALVARIAMTAKGPAERMVA